MELSKNSKIEMCYECQANIAHDKAIVEGQFLIEAEIISFEPADRGQWTDISELNSIRVKTNEGEIIEFTAGGYEERYIEWEELEQGEVDK